MKIVSWIRPRTRPRASYLFVLLVFALTFALFDLPNSPESEAAAGDGSWSSGDRLAEANHLSSGWKKIDSLPPTGFVGESRNWSPAIASTLNRTVMLWAPSLAAPLVGFQWFPSHGTWKKDGSFFTKPLPFDSIKSAPALVQRRNSLLDVVVLGKDQYYHAFHTGSPWSNWEGLGLPHGLVGGSPAITASKTGVEKIDVWVIANGTLFQKHWQQSTSWQEWTPVASPGVPLIGSPGATTRSDNTIDIVAAG